jgi:hypothetical protein
MSLVGGDPVAVVDGQGVEDGLPSVDLADRVGPACLSFLSHQVENLEGGLLVGEVGSALQGPTETGVETLSTAFVAGMTYLALRSRSDGRKVARVGFGVSGG